VCVTDGDPCDDLDICTPSSTCTSGVCVGPDLGSCVVAASMAEFDSTQGVDGWYYGGWNLSFDGDGLYNPSTEFETFAWLGNAWRPDTWEADPSPNFTWAYMMAWGGHTGSYPARRATIRRWVSDVSGRANLEVFVAKADTGGGDGVRALAFVDGTLVLDRAVPFDDGDGFTETIPIDLTIGARVDVLMHPNNNDSQDTSDLRVRVLSR
jgi:hypothetical protein